MVAAYERLRLRIEAAERYWEDLFGRNLPMAAMAVTEQISVAHERLSKRASLVQAENETEGAQRQVKAFADRLVDPGQMPRWTWPWSGCGQRRRRRCLRSPIGWNTTEESQV